jgi:hypothetical protein
MGNGMYLLCPDESFDGIAASIRMTIVISENIKGNSLGRRLGKILGGCLVQLICEFFGESPDCFLGARSRAISVLRLGDSEDICPIALEKLYQYDTGAVSGVEVISSL